MALGSLLLKQLRVEAHLGFPLPNHPLDHLGQAPGLHGVTAELDKQRHRGRLEPIGRLGIDDRQEGLGLLTRQLRRQRLPGISLERLAA